MALVELRNVSKIYSLGGEEIRALDDVTLDIAPAEFISIIGPSGSGKSTLMHILGCLDSPTRGTIRLDGTEIHGATPRELAQIRNRKIGFVFQFFNLLPTMSARENVMLPGLLAGLPEREASERATKLLENVGLSKRADHRPDELSGGEMQRTALARALVTQPRLLLADEPTGNLDSKTGDEIFGLMRALTRRENVAIVMVTHDPNAAARADRILSLKDGRLVSDELTAHAGAA
jgi:putative ABC transport system ATP-binding protein